MEETQVFPQVIFGISSNGEIEEIKHILETLKLKKFFSFIHAYNKTRNKKFLLNLSTNQTLISKEGKDEFIYELTKPESIETNILNLQHDIVKIVYVDDVPDLRGKCVVNLPKESGGLKEEHILTIHQLIHLHAENFAKDIAAGKIPKNSRPIVIVIYDNDCTLSVYHHWKTTHWNGYKGIKPKGEDESFEEYFTRLYGGINRINNLRKWLSDQQNHSIVWKNMINKVSASKKLLEEKKEPDKPDKPDFDFSRIEALNASPISTPPMKRIDLTSVIFSGDSSDESSSLSNSSSSNCSISDNLDLSTLSNKIKLLNNLQLNSTKTLEDVSESPSVLSLSNSSDYLENSDTNLSSSLNNEKVDNKEIKTKNVSKLRSSI